MDAISKSWDAFSFGDTFDDAKETADRFVRRNMDHSDNGEYGQSNFDGEFDDALFGAPDNADHVRLLTDSCCKLSSGCS